MWTVCIGVALGMFEMFLLKKNVAMMSASKSNIPLGIFLSVGKLALILVVLFVIARYISLTAMLWCAGGMAAVMIIVPIVQCLATIRSYRRNGGDEQ